MAFSIYHTIQMDISTTYWNIVIANALEILQSCNKPPIKHHTLTYQDLSWMWLEEQSRRHLLFWWRRRSHQQCHLSCRAHFGHPQLRHHHQWFLSQRQSVQKATVFQYFLSFRHAILWPISQQFILSPNNQSPTLLQEQSILLINSCHRWTINSENYIMTADICLYIYIFMFTKIMFFIGDAASHHSL